MKLNEFKIVIALAVFSSLAFALSACGDDDNNKGTVGHLFDEIWYNFAIYNGANQRVIFSVHGDNLTTKWYMMDAGNYLITHKNDLEVDWWNAGHGDKMYIDGISLGSGYYNAIYITGNDNLSLASAQSEDSLAGHYWGGANLGTICPGGTSGNWLDVSWGSNDEHHTTGKEIVVGKYLETPDDCNNDERSIWLYTYSGTGEAIPWDKMPQLSFNDVYKSENQEIPQGNWVNNCAWQTSVFNRPLKHMTVTCQNSQGEDVHNKNFYYGDCSDMIVNVDPGGTGKLECGD